MKTMPHGLTRLRPTQSGKDGCANKKIARTGPKSNIDRHVGIAPAPFAMALGQTRSCTAHLPNDRTGRNGRPGLQKGPLDRISWRWRRLRELGKQALLQATILQQAFSPSEPEPRTGFHSFPHLHTERRLSGRPPAGNKQRWKQASDSANV